MVFRTAAVIVAAFALVSCGGEDAAVDEDSLSWEKVAFASVPGNIIDAPVSRPEWREVEKTTYVSGPYVFTWIAVFNGGATIVEQVSRDGVFAGEDFYGDKAFKRLVADFGFTGLNNVEAVGNQTDKWGSIVDATREGIRCVMGIVAAASPTFDAPHQGAGDITGMFFDCRGDAVSRRADWRSWLRSFKAVGPGYNKPLDG